MAGRTVKKKSASAARQAAARTLAAVARGAKLDEALARAVQRPLSRGDAAFAEELTKAVVRHRRFIDYQLGLAAREPLTKLPPPIWNSLRLGAAELFFMRTPPYAAVNEAVALVKNSPFAQLAPLVNAILRHLAARGAAAEPERDEAERLGVRYSYPDWLVRRWLQRFGTAEAEELLAAGNAPAALTVFANPTRASREDLATSLARAGCSVSDGPFGALAVELGDVGLTALPDFAAGRFVVLDPASTLAPRWLAPPAGATVLDLGAGVGGKSVQLAWLVGPGGTILAADKSARKLKALRAAARRLGITNIEVRQADILEEELPQADYVLLDAPCTNLGVVRRKPDVKWRLCEEDVAAAAATQTALLARAAAAVSASGRLVYNVCSTEREEGEHVVEQFLKATPGWRLLPPPDIFGDAGEGPYVRTWPHRHRCNGGFAAALRREG